MMPLIAASSPNAAAAAGSVMQVALTPLGAVTVASSGGDLANIVAGAQPIRTVMSNSLGLALMGGLGVVLVLLVGTRLVILRRQS